MKNLCLTFDIDWAPEKVIEDTILLLENANAKATFFTTHHSAVLKSLANERFEIALHPNYNPMIYGDKKFDAMAPLQQLLEIYPHSIGARTHGLVMCPPIIDALRSLGLKYDSSLLLYNQPGAVPFLLFKDFYRIPFHWEDDVHFYRGDSFIQNIDFSSQNYWVLNYHPVHVYLNTDLPQTYLNAKEYYQDADKLLELRNRANPGTRSHLIAVLDKIKNNDVRSYTMTEYLDNCFVDQKLYSN